MTPFKFSIRPALIVCAALILPSTSLLAKRFLVNKIIARVNGSNIFLSAAQEPHLEKGGAPYTFEELINEELLCQKAADVKREATNTDVDRAISSFKIQNNLTGLTDEEFDKMLKENGFTLSMLRRHHSRSMSAWGIRGMEVDNKVVITSQEVEEYWKKHPEYSKEEFHLKLPKVIFGKEL